MEHIPAFVLGTFLEGGVWEPEQPHQSIGRGCAVRGSSWEGGTLPGKAARQLWHGHPLQTWKRASALSLSFEWGHFCPSLSTRLVLSSSSSWEFQGSRSPSSGRKKLHTYWSELVLLWGSKPSNPFMFSHLSPPDKPDCVPATTERGTFKGGPEFAMGRSVFLLTSQLLPLLFPAYCIQSWSAWDTTSVLYVG